MDTEILYVILLLIFIAIIGYVFYNCNCSCGVREGFSNRCPCAHGTGSTSGWYCGPSARYAYVLGGNDYCVSCNHGSVKGWKTNEKGWAKECPAPPPPSAPAPAPDPAPSNANCSKGPCPESTIRHGTTCQTDGYPTCHDNTNTYKKSNKNNFVLGDKVELSNKNCDWQETNDSKKIKRYDDKICTGVTGYISQSSIGSGRGGAQAMTIKDLTNYCNSVPSCYGWARNNQQGDHKVQLCEKNASSTTSLNNNSHYDVYTCNSDYVCPSGYELKFNSSENKYECSTCPAGKYKSGKNANDCVPCKSSCPPGKTLNGSCPAGSTSDTKTCVQIETVNTSSYTEVEAKYRPWYKNFMGYEVNTADKARDKCNDIGDNCAAVYSVDYPTISYYYSVTPSVEAGMSEGKWRTDYAAYWNKKYIKN